MKYLNEIVEKVLNLIPLDQESEKESGFAFDPIYIMYTLQIHVYYIW